MHTGYDSDDNKLAILQLFRRIMNWQIVTARIKTALKTTRNRLDFCKRRWGETHDITLELIHEVGYALLLARNDPAAEPFLRECLRLANAKGATFPVSRVHNLASSLHN
jgi:hypothetical protein